MFKLFLNYLLNCHVYFYRNVCLILSEPLFYILLRTYNAEDASNSNRHSLFLRRNYSCPILFNIFLESSQVQISFSPMYRSAGPPFLVLIPTYLIIQDSVYLAELFVSIK
jgi:hypothetical protein